MRFIAILICSALTFGCQSPESDRAASDLSNAANAPFSYHGHVLSFPTDTVDVRLDGRLGGKYPYARLVPEGKLASDQLRDTYMITLGKIGTGEAPYGRQIMGNRSYGPEAQTIDLGDGYKMWCSPIGRAMPAFDCSVQLHTLPLAVVSFRDSSIPAAFAIGFVHQAENYLRASELESR